MLELMERPVDARARRSRDDAMTQAALWIVDVLAEELARDADCDRAALVEALMRRAGYEQADSLIPGDGEKLRAALVARVAGRLARA
jgi:hypothetical protein